MKVRIVSAICPVHGERVDHPTSPGWGDPTEDEMRKIFDSEALRKDDAIGCGACRGDGVATKLLVATEPAEGL